MSNNVGLVPVAAVTLGDTTRHLFAGQTLRIGRDLTCDLLSADPRISRVHLTVTADADGNLVVQDMDSANGTFLQDTRVLTFRVVDDATFGLGNPDGDHLTIQLNQPTNLQATPLRQPTDATLQASPSNQTTFQPPQPGNHQTGRTTGHPHRPTGHQSFQPSQPPNGGHSPTQQVSHQTFQAQPPVDDYPADHTSGHAVLVDANQIALGHDITIGRAPDNTIVLDDPLVSRYHARLTRTAGGYRIIDLSSLNGIQLNGRGVVGGATLTASDRLTIGRTTLRLAGGEIVSSSEELGGALIANNLSFTLKGGKDLLRNISFAVPSGNLVAVVGPSGAGKSTLLRAITGSQPATEGEVIYQGQNLYGNFASLRQLIGVVPQDDVVHRQLTVRRALSYAAELRLPSDYSKPAREREVTRVINDLKLDEHENTKISRLSGGQRKRTSVAMELLTQPPLLLLDEPTSGLDPGLDLDVMKLLRGQADGGRTVLVVTHSTDNLDLCDQVLVLAPGGMVAYYGPPGGILGYFGFDRYASVFSALSADPKGHAARWSQTHAVQLPPPAAIPHKVDSKSPRQRVSRQWSTLVRRQLRIIASDRSYALSAVLLPVIIAAMTLVIPGDTGFGKPPPDGVIEPTQLLVIITVGAAFMGMAASIRELISERPIFLRERTVGLSPMIYLSAKVCVLFAMTLLQSAILIGVVRAGKPGPDSSIWDFDPTLELWFAVLGTSFASALMGLLLSALVGTGEQTMPALVITIMAQLVFCGGLIAIADRGALELVAAIFPSRWGFAQAASTVDLRSLDPTAPNDSLWEQTAESWFNAGAALLAIGTISLVLTAVKLVKQPSTT